MNAEQMELEYVQCEGHLKARCMFHDVQSGAGKCNCIDCRTMRLLTAMHAEMGRMWGVRDRTWLLAADLVASYRTQGDWDADLCNTLEHDMREKAARRGAP